MRPRYPQPAALWLVLLLASPVAGQVAVQGWIGDDGFDVECCTLAEAVNLPSFPAFEVDGTWASIKDCDLDTQFGVRFATEFLQIACDVALMPFSVMATSEGAPGWTGVLIAKYARTWVETDPNGPEVVQVWRWLINTDASPVGGAPPSALPPHPSSMGTHLTGHIDYGCFRDPQGSGALVFRMAVNLNHLPGCISHSPLGATPLGPPPGPFSHHDRSYHLVAPATGFTFSPSSAPSGPVLAESTRNSTMPPLPYRCIGEGELIGGQIESLGRTCLCPSSRAEGPFLWDHLSLVAGVRCRLAQPPSVVTSIGVNYPAPPLPTGLSSLPLGAWTGTDSFPGMRSLRIYFGVLQYADPCVGGGIPLQVVSGVSTRGPGGTPFGETVSATSPPPYPVFLDLQDMIMPFGLLGAYSLGFGTFFLSSTVWSLNLY